MPRIALIGAGSQVFATTLIGDVLSYPELSDSEQAVKLDSLTAAACTLAEIDEMVDVLIEANAEWLPAPS